MTHGILTDFFFFENMSTLVQKESQRYKQTLKNWWHFFIPFIPMINYLKWNYAFTYTNLLEIKQEKKPPTMIHNWIFHFYAHPTSLFLMARQFSDCSFKLLWYQWNTWKIEIIQVFFRIIFILTLEIPGYFSSFGTLNCRLFIVRWIGFY